MGDTKSGRARATRATLRSQVDTASSATAYGSQEVTSPGPVLLGRVFVSDRACNDLRRRRAIWTAQTADLHTKKRPRAGWSSLTMRGQPLPSPEEGDRGNHTRVRAVNSDENTQSQRQNDLIRQLYLY